MTTFHVAKRSCSAWSARKAWGRARCSLPLGWSSMPSTVPATDQRLVEGTTYIYQGTQTQVLQVPVISASPISVLLDSRRRSSQVLKILLLQIMKCLDSTSEDKQMKEDNAGKILSLLYLQVPRLAIMCILFVLNSTIFGRQYFARLYFRDFADRGKRKREH